MCMCACPHLPCSTLAYAQRVTGERCAIANHKNGLCPLLKDTKQCGNRLDISPCCVCMCVRTHIYVRVGGCMYTCAGVPVDPPQMLFLEQLLL